MITGMDAGKLAFFGTLILALGSLIGGIGGVATKSYLDAAKEEETKRSNQKTNVYLEFLKTKLALEQADSDVKNFETKTGKLRTQEESRELARLNKIKRDISNKHFEVRDRLIVFGSAKIVSEVARYDRKKYREREQSMVDRTPEVGTDSGTVESPLPELAIAFRRDTIGEDADLLDVIAVMCGPTPKKCFGVPVEAYLGKKDN